jgi:hypothetical protein
MVMCVITTSKYSSTLKYIITFYRDSSNIFPTVAIITSSWSKHSLLALDTSSTVLALSPCISVLDVSYRTSRRLYSPSFMQINNKQSRRTCTAIIHASDNRREIGMKRETLKIYHAVHVLSHVMIEALQRFYLSTV